MPSQDPRQQALRTHKKSWNAKYKAFSQGLKAFKDSVNGKGKSPGKIIDPIPSEVISMLGELSSKFSELVSDANGIFDEQKNYSATRRKKQVKQPGIVQPIAPQPDQIVNTLSQLGSTEQTKLEALGTNRLSRSWEYFKSMFYRDELQKQRVSLLRLCADLFYSLRNLQDEALTIHLENTPNVIQAYQGVRYSFTSVVATTTRLVEIMEREKQKLKQMEEQAQNQQNTSEIPATEQPKSNQQPPGVAKQQKMTSLAVVKDIKAIADIFLSNNMGQEQANQINALYEQYFAANDEQKHLVRKRMQELHKEMIIASKPELEKRYGPITPEHTLEKLVREMVAGKIPKEASEEYLEIIKEARNPLTRFLKRQLTKLRPSDATVSHRLDISNSIDAARNIVRDMMDSLQEGLDIERLNKDTGEIKIILADIAKPLQIIITLYERKTYEDPEQRSKFRGRQSITNDPMMDFVMRRKIRKDLGQGIF